MKTLAPSVGLALGLAAAGAACAAVTEDIRHQHYEVIDRAGRDLVAGLDRASPFAPRHGHTD